MVEILPPEGEAGVQIEDISEGDMEMIASLPMLPARVKWFDKVKGFGFANVFERSDDIFIHVEVLRRSGFADLQPGEAVGLKVIDGKRGLMAALVLSWEAALRDRR